MLTGLFVSAFLGTCIFTCKNQMNTLIQNSSVLLDKLICSHIQKLLSQWSSRLEFYFDSFCPFYFSISWIKEISHILTYTLKGRLQFFAKSLNASLTSSTFSGMFSFTSSTVSFASVSAFSARYSAPSVPSSTAVA